MSVQERGRLLPGVLNIPYIPGGFGGFLRITRRDRDFTQKELSQGLGFKDTDTLRGVEAGLSSVDRQTFNRLSGILDWTPEERALALLLAKIAPTDAEKTQWLEQIREYVELEGPPIFARDYTGQILLPSEGFKKLIRFSKSYSEEELPNMWQVFVDDDILLVEGGSQAYKNNVAQFRYQTMPYKEQKWRKDLLIKFACSDLFLKTWSQTDDIAVEDEIGSSRMFHRRIMLPSPDGSEILTLVQITCPATLDYRFQVEFLVPYGA